MISRPKADLSTKPTRLLVVLPSWLGDGVMATPALRILRDALPGAFIAGLARPSVAQTLSHVPMLDEIIVERASGVMGPKRAAARVRPFRFDTALLLTNSFSTALATRIAGIPRRVGYDRDGRGLLLTHRLHAPAGRGVVGSGRRWHVVPAVAYYVAAARALLGDAPPPFADMDDPMEVVTPGVGLELPVTESDRQAGTEVLRAAGVPSDAACVVLNPGANNPAKRWPAKRFARLADHLAERGFCVLLNTGPGESDVADAVLEEVRTTPVVLARHGQTLGALKSILARSRLLVTNDTGPRHLAAAVGVPTISLFGPTDPRWTVLPEVRDGTAREVRLAAQELGPDPLSPDELADDHPERCRIEQIGLDLVIDAADRLLGSAPAQPLGS